MQTKNAVGNLINRYRSVLKKCHLLNTFGSLALCSLLVAGAVGGAALSFTAPVAHAAAGYEATLDRLDAAGVQAILTAQTKISYFDTDAEWTAYIATLTTDPSSSYVLTPNVTAGSADYYTTFEYDSVTYGVLLKGHDYDASAPDESKLFNNIQDFVSYTATTKYADAASTHPYSKIEQLTTAAVEDDPATIATNEQNYTFKVRGVEKDGTPYTLYFAAQDASGTLIQPTNNRTTAPSGPISENFIGNQGSTKGAAISVESADIASIVGDFMGNTVINAAGDALGGAVYYGNATDGGAINTLGSLTGNFLGNAAYGVNAKGGALYNELNGTITAITGDFMGNMAIGTAEAYGGAIFTNGTIATITGDFIGNSAIAETKAHGGALYSYDNYPNYRYVVTLMGDFIGNSVTSTAADSEAYGGALYAESGMATLMGDFIGNSVTAGGDSSTASGGAAYIYASVSGILGDFIGNSVTVTGADSYASGGAVYDKVDTEYNGDFIGNSATATGARSDAYGGALHVSQATITGDFLYNSATADDNVFGGAIRNNSSIFGDITASTFIGNKATSVNGEAQGGAIHATGEIGTLDADFFNNSATGSEYAQGGALFTDANITSLIGDFSGNKAEGGGAHGGAIMILISPGSSQKIDSITGDFTNNTARATGETDDASGGAIATSINMELGTVVGDFTGNSVHAVKGESKGGALAIYFTNTTATFSSNFTGNSAVSSGGLVLGGALYANANIAFLADGNDYSISGNYTSNDNGLTKDYNAIYINEANRTLQFTLNNGGTYTLNDNVRTTDGLGGTEFKISGDGSAGAGLTLNNALYNIASVSVNNSALTLGDTVHGTETFSGNIGDAMLTVVSGTVTINTDTAFNNAVDLQGSTISVSADKTLTFGSGATLTMDATASLDLTDANVEAANGVLGTVDITNAGNMFTPSADLGGDITSTADSTLTITGFSGDMSASDYRALRTEVQTDLGGLLGTINFDGFNVITTNLTDVFSDINTPTQTLMAGTLSHQGTTIIAGITKNTSSGLTNSVVEEGATLTLTGGEVGAVHPLLDEGSLTSSGTLNLGTGTFSGNLNVTKGTTNITGSTRVTGDVVATAGTLIVNAEGQSIKFESAVQAASMIVQKGDVDVWGTFTNNGGVTLTGGTLDILGGVAGTGTYSLQGGGLLLGGTVSPDAADTLGAITVENANSTLKVLGGSWTAGALTVTEGTVDISGGSLTLTQNLDTQAGSLSVTSSGKLHLDGNNLSADFADFGTVDFTTGAFSEANTMTGTITGTNASTITLTSAITGMLFDNEYDLLLDTLQTSFSSTSFEGTINLVGIDRHSTLADLSDATGGATKVVGAGTYTSVTDSVIGGIVAADRGGTIVDSVINTDGSLTLTGNGPVDLSVGSIDVEKGTLYLGYDGTNATAGGKVDGNLLVGSVGNAAIVYAEGTANSITGDLVVNTDGLMSIDNDDKNASLTVEGVNGIKVSGGRSNGDIQFRVYGGSVSATKLSLESGGTALINGGELTLTGADGVSVDAGTMEVGGSLTTQKIDISNGGRLGIASTATITMNGARSLSIDGTGSTFILGTNLSVATFGMANGGALTLIDNATLTAENSLALTGGSLNLGQGTLNVNGFSNTANALELTGGTLKSMSGITSSTAVTLNGGNLELAGSSWTATADVTVTQGTLNVSSGGVDVSNVIFTAGANATLASTNGTDLTVDHATIGMEQDGVTASSATVAGADVTGLLGKVVIKGFDNVFLDYATEYSNLVAAAQIAYGTQAEIILEGVDKDTSNTSLKAVADQNDTSLSLNSVQVDPADPTSNQVGAGNRATVGAINGVDGSGVAAQNQGDLTVTGTAADAPGQIAMGHIITTGAGNTNLGNTESQSTHTGDVDSSASTGNTSITRLDVLGDILSSAGTTVVTASSANTLTTHATGLTEIRDGLTTMVRTMVNAGGLMVHSGGILQTENLETSGGIVASIGGTHFGGIMATFVNSVGDVFSHDPDFVAGVGIEGATFGVYGDFGTTQVASTYVAGRNSYVVLGDVNTTWATDTFANSNLTWGNGADDISAALFIKAPQTLSTVGNGAVIVDGTLVGVQPASPAGTASFADNSLFVVDAGSVGTTAALTATNGILTVDNGAKLMIAGSVDGAVTVLTGFDDAASVVADGAWGYTRLDPSLFDESTVLTDSLAYEVSSVSWDNGTFTANVRQTKVEVPYLNQDQNAFLTEAASASGLNAPSQAFIDYATSRTASGTAQADAAQLVQGSAEAAAVGAVAASSADVASSIAGVVTAYNTASGVDRTKGGAHVMHKDSNGQVSVNGGSDMRTGFGVWATPVYKWSDVDGMQSGSFENGYESGLGGVALGLDYTTEQNLRFGLAVSAGAGYADSDGDFYNTDNDFDFWGVTAYGAFRKNNVGLSFDLGYSAINSELSQDTSAGLNQNTADVDSDVITAGLHAEYVFKTSVADIIPHVGVRYMHVSTDGYTVKSGNQTLFDVESDSQNIWSIPVGVTVSKDIALKNDWAFTPRLDLGVTFHAGDLDTESTARMPGVLSTFSSDMEMRDEVAFTGGVGFDLGNDTVSFGLNYNINASSNETGHMVSGSFMYKF